MKQLISKVKFKLFPQFIKSEEYANYLREKGIAIGKGTFFFGPATTVIDTQRPWMISIGEYCKITAGVVILCHDYSRSVLRRKYGEIVGEANETVIGNNVFIGTNSIILMGTKIGDNTIIGAGSVVSGVLPPNSVCCGNPARVIRSLDEHYRIRKEKTLNEARKWVVSFYKHYGRMPKENEMGPFWQLFMPRDKDYVSKHLEIALNGDNIDEMMEYFLNMQPEFASYEEFVKWCNIEE